VKGNELVWRALADAALTGRRDWSSVADLAHASGTPVSTASLALQRMHDIGATERRRNGGVIAVNPEKILLVLAAWRNLKADEIGRTTLGGATMLIERANGHYALGGSNAAITYVSGASGRNTIATHPTRLVYVKDEPLAHDLPAGDEVIILRMDKRAQLDWYDGYTSRAQTYADLFALPGWQAEEFRRALHRVLFPPESRGQNVEALRG
jgi:hypothetical protein